MNLCFSSSVLKRMLSTQGFRKRLNQSRRLDIIAKLQRTSPASKWALAQEFGVTYNVICKIWMEQEGIKQKTLLMSNAAHEIFFHTTAGKFDEIEDALYQ
jgi:hypothetical protein